VAQLTGDAVVSGDPIHSQLPPGRDAAGSRCLSKESIEAGSSSFREPSVPSMGITAPTSVSTPLMEFGVVLPNLPKSRNNFIRLPPEEVLIRTAKMNKITYVGDNHGQNAIPQFLRRSVSGLKNQAGINTLFIEFVDHRDNAVLQYFLQTGDPCSLKQYLERNLWHIGYPGWIDEIVETLDAFRKEGIEVVGMDAFLHRDPSGNYAEQRTTVNSTWAKVIITTLRGNSNAKALVWGGLHHFSRRAERLSVNNIIRGPIIAITRPHLDSDRPSEGRAAYTNRSDPTADIKISLQ
jgi:hypothetical protein